MKKRTSIVLMAGIWFSGNLMAAEMNQSAVPGFVANHQTFGIATMPRPPKPPMVMGMAFSRGDNQLTSQTPFLLTTASAGLSDSHR